VAAKRGHLRTTFACFFTELLANDKENDYVFFWFSHNADELDRLASSRWREHAVRLDDQRSIRSHISRRSICSSAL